MSWWPLSGLTYSCFMASERLKLTAGSWYPSHDGKYEGTEWLCIVRSSRRCAGCFFWFGSQLFPHGPILSAKPREALTGPYRFLARTATPLPDGAPSAASRSSTTIKRSIRCGECTKKCSARSAISSPCLPTLASNVRTVTPIFTSARWGPIARGVTRCSAGMLPSSK
jgi:hypothetical protein